MDEKDIERVPEERGKSYAQLLERAQQLEQAEQARLGFMEFVQLAWPEFINGRHHKIL